MSRFGRCFSGLVLGLVTIAAGIGTGVLTSALQGEAAGAASVINVNTPTDDSTITAANCTPGSEVADSCNLRDALSEAGDIGDTDINLPDPDTIGGSGHIYQVLTSVGPLTVDDSGHTVTITGTSGQATTILQAQCSECSITTRVINVTSGTTADISGVTVEDGVATGVFPAGAGGGILNDGTLNLSYSTVSGNSALSGGGVFLEAGTGNLFNDTVTNNTSTAGGGGVFITDGANSVTGGSISNDSASTDGGAVYIQNDNPGDSVTISGVTMDNNDAEDGGAAYVENDGTSGTNVSFTNDTVRSNTAVDDAGGVYVENDGTHGTVTFTGGSISNNTATSSDGGAAYLENDGTNTTVSFTNVAANSNTAHDSGGGVYLENDGTSSTVNFTGGSVDDNTASDDDGGGVYMENDGDPSIANFSAGSLSGNYAYEGGGVYVGGGTNTFNQETIAGNIVGEAGGGVAVDGGESSTTGITASTISGNTVQGLVGISAVLGDGGGILSDACNAITLTNDTIVSNTATNGGGYFGTGCPESPTVSTVFEFDTISGNTATDGETGAGNVQRIDDSTLTMADTIVANGSASGGPATNCAFTGPGTFTSQGYNLFGDSTCGAGVATDIIGKDPQLGPLANNGGPTETLLPADASPEVGAIPDATWVASGVAADQRGVARGAGANSSATIGAVEVGQNFNGYRMVGNEGGIFDFGLLFSGSLADNHLNAPIVDIANAPGPAGYLMVGGDGGVFALGGAAFFGSLGGQVLPSPIAAIAATPTENGYWLIAQNGKIYPFGSVPSLPALSLPPGAHIVGMASTNTGEGIWATDQYGDVYAEGDALYEGGLGGVHINAPIVGIAAAAVGQGYVLVASDGGVFNYNMGFYGSVPGSLKAGQHLVAPIVGIAVTHSGKGYWEVGADGGLFDYGDAPFLGSIYTAIPGKKLNGPIVGIQHLGATNPAG